MWFPRRSWIWFGPVWSDGETRSSKTCKVGPKHICCDLCWVPAWLPLCCSSQIHPELEITLYTLQLCCQVSLIVTAGFRLWGDRGWNRLMSSHEFWCISLTCDVLGRSEEIYCQNQPVHWANILWPSPPAGRRCSCIGEILKWCYCYWFLLVAVS